MHFLDTNHIWYCLYLEPLYSSQSILYKGLRWGVVPVLPPRNVPPHIFQLETPPVSSALRGHSHSHTEKCCQSISAFGITSISETQRDPKSCPGGQDLSKFHVQSTGRVMFETCQISGGDDKICMVIASFHGNPVLPIDLESSGHTGGYNSKFICDTNRNSNLEADSTQRWFQGMFWQGIWRSSTNPWNHVENCWRQATLLEILDPEQNTTFKASGILDPRRRKRWWYNDGRFNHLGWVVEYIYISRISKTQSLLNLTVTMSFIRPRQRCQDHYLNTPFDLSQPQDQKTIRDFCFPH